MDGDKRIEMIDRQHRELFDIFLELQTCRGDVARDYMEDLFNKLEEYFRNHFTFEERFMANIGFPELEDHAKLHQEIRFLVFQAKEKFLKSDQSDETSATIHQLSLYLEKWLRNHILSVDMKYRSFIDVIN